MDALKVNVVSRRLFTGSIAASSVAVAGLGELQVPCATDLDGKVCKWLDRMARSYCIQESQDGTRLYHVKIDTTQRVRFYESLAETFPKPRIEENNLVEIRSDGQSTRFQVV